LREANEDDHDLVSGRQFPEFIYPTDQLDDALVNMTNWDTYMYSRQSKAIDDMRALRQTTRLLTYPVTVTSFLHELSPYTTRDRLTAEGLRSLMGTMSYQVRPLGWTLTDSSSSSPIYAPPTRPW
jgi:mitochondrial splicing suppressor protein 51